jgi:hypothetical protein
MLCSQGEENQRENLVIDCIAGWEKIPQNLGSLSPASSDNSMSDMIFTITVSAE